MEVGYCQGINTILHTKHNFNENQRQPGMFKSQFLAFLRKNSILDSSGSLIHF